MRLYLGELGPARIFGRTLLILCSYEGGVTSSAPQRSSSRFVRLITRVIGMVTLRSLCAYVPSMREHYANPRPLPMIVQLAQAVLAAGEVTSFRVIVDARLAPSGIGDLWPNVEASITPLDRFPLDLLRDPDTVVLVYPDPLGLGFGRFESQLIAMGASNIVILNGRRRLFPLTAAARRVLWWRRVLASTRLLEAVAAIGLVPFAAILATYDRFRGRI